MKKNQRISISRGNSKLGSVINVSTVPRRCCPEGVPCANGGCYALKAYRMYPATRRAWTRNERIARRHPDVYFSQIAERVAKVRPCLFRWHVAGDILSVEYLRGMCQVATENPSTHFLAFTKGFDIVNRYEYLQALPDNLVIIFSAWPGMIFANPHGHRIAWMQDGTETRVPEDAVECPGNCESCGLCYDLPRLGVDVVFRKH